MNHWKLTEFTLHDTSSAIPIDQFELQDLDIKIIVPKGDYRIEIYNWNNEVVKILDNIKFK